MGLLTGGKDLPAAVIYSSEAGKKVLIKSAEAGILQYIFSLLKLLMSFFISSLTMLGSY